MTRERVCRLEFLPSEDIRLFPVGIGLGASEQSVIGIHAAEIGPAGIRASQSPSVLQAPACAKR